LACHAGERLTFGGMLGRRVLQVNTVLDTHYVLATTALTAYSLPLHLFALFL
jgi:hypothetical protein